jgi:hypothetical protein
MSPTTETAYVYVAESQNFPGRWVVQIIQGSTVYTPDDNLTADARDATVAEARAAFPCHIVSWDE